MRDRFHDQALVLFAKDPVIGQVKTRLHPFLDQETILELYSNFLRDSIRILFAVEGVDRFIGVYPSHLSNFFSRWREEPPVTLFVQEGKDLGERMRNTFAARFDEGYRKTVIMGADSPSLPARYLEQAFQSEKDLVIGPSTDGGYYLIGMNREMVEVFQGVSWGSNQVLRETLERVTKSGASIGLLPVWYDVDRPENVLFLKTHLDLMEQSGLGDPGATGEFLKGLRFPQI
ncbi:MAG: TIGR04282 family arsenosugar biosynthesis glycosyltransferase [Nitrospinaceae bacterium]